MTRKMGKAERAAIRHGEPSAESLNAVPEMDFVHGRFMKGRGREAMANGLKFVALVRGRPRKGAQAAGSKARSIRLPDFAWAELEQEAKRRKMSLHKLLRVIVADHLYTSSWAELKADRQAAKGSSSGGARKSPAKKPKRARKAA